MEVLLTHLELFVDKYNEHIALKDALVQLLDLDEKARKDPSKVL